MGSGRACGGNCCSRSLISATCHTSRLSIVFELGCLRMGDSLKLSMSLCYTSLFLKVKTKNKAIALWQSVDRYTNVRFRNIPSSFSVDLLPPLHANGISPVRTNQIFSRSRSIASYPPLRYIHDLACRHWCDSSKKLDCSSRKT